MQYKQGLTLSIIGQVYERQRSKYTKILHLGIHSQKGLLCDSVYLDDPHKKVCSSKTERMFTPKLSTMMQERSIELENLKQFFLNGFRIHGHIIIVVSNIQTRLLGERPRIHGVRLLVAYSMHSIIHRALTHTPQQLERW